jgi:ATP-dependent RNA helicase DDX19/DBP5
MLPPNTQTLLFSATFPDKVVAFSQKFAPNANQIRLKQEELSVEGIKQFFMDCADNEAKYDVLLEIYNLLTVGQSIIFCRVSRPDSSILWVNIQLKKRSAIL